MTVNQYDLSLKVYVHCRVNFVYVKVDFPRGGTPYGTDGDARRKS